MLRIPGWAREVSVRINGELAATKPQPGQYFKLKRAWVAGDKIELDIPLPVRLLEAHPLVEENRNEVAVMRGPLVYCLESVDLPQGVRPSEVLIPRDLELKPRSNKMPGELMAEIVVLEGRARLLPEQRERLHPLKRELRVAPLGEVEIKMIPYYAWANRGKSEMTVWLPLVW